MPERVRITDVSPRDGLQNEPGLIATSDKVRLIRLLATTGVDEIEATSFVSPKWVPQLGDAAEVLKALAAEVPPPAAGACAAPVLSALVPNERGLEAALAANAAAGKSLISKVSVFTAASETFARRNTNASIAETLDRFRPVVAQAHRAGLAVRGYVSCVIACPFEGPIAPAVVAAWSGRLLDLGIDELDLGDTIGAGTADTTRAMLDAVGRVCPLGGSRVPLTLHLHDTFGHAAECVRAALDMGVRSFDGSVAGLGGCPYASKTLPDGSVRRAPGNISTELLVRTIHAAGFTTGASTAALDHAAAQARLMVAAARATVGGSGWGGQGGSARVILTSIANHVATITLNRPERRNAMTPRMLADLRAAVEEIAPVAPARADVRALVLAGAGKVFCAGFDLDPCRDHADGSVMRELLAGLSLAVVSLRACGVPVVVAAHGAAIAGGCALLGGADFVVADAAAKFGYPVVRLGVSPAVNIPFVRLVMGDGPTRARTLDTRLIDGAEAHCAGLVSDLVPTPDEVLPAARALAASLAAKPPHGLLATRRWMDELSPADASRGLAASLALTGGAEERRLLPQVWSARP